MISDDVGAKLKSALWQERLPPDSASVSAADAAAWRATFWGGSRMGDPKAEIQVLLDAAAHPAGLDTNARGTQAD